MIDKIILYRFFEGKATQSEEKVLLKWLKESENNLHEYLTERKNYDFLLVSDNNRQNPVDVDLEYQKFYRHINKMRKRNLSLTHFIRFAAGIAALFLLGFFIWNSHTPSKIKENELAEAITTNKESKGTSNLVQGEYIAVTTPKGSKQSFRLPDNTIVWLNSATELRYPKQFASNTREVWLDGEAHFTVAHNSNQQFIVHTSGFDVKVYGTTFNVWAYKNEPNKKFTLIEGSVTLEFNDNKEKQKEIFLSPGQQAVCQSGQIDVKKVETDYETAWKEDKFYFQAQTFFEICRQLERAFNVNICIENESLKNVTFSGQFTKNETIYEILSIITHDQRINYSIHENNITMYEK